MTLGERVRNAIDPDRALQAIMTSLVEAAGIKYALDIDQVSYRAGRPFKLLLVGYVGTRNTGADLRSEEIVRQFRTLFGDRNFDLSIVTLDPRLTAGYFRTARQVHMPMIFPKFLYQECQKYHGVVACEGSMFKSKFANSLSIMMASALGMSSAAGKLSVGYGGEAGEMVPALRDFVRKQCSQSLIICRNQPSREILEAMGIRTKGGTDTAWTFEPAPLTVGRDILAKHGWDGRKRVLAVCPINPFWWPVKPDVVKALAKRFGGQFNREHYQALYFHHWSEETAERFERYLDGLAYAINGFSADRAVFPILIGMEQLDREACERLRDKLDVAPPLFISDRYNMYEMVSILHNCALVLSSRFHAIVTSMTAFVPSAGVTMDERIRTLMNDRGHRNLLVEVDAEDLGEEALVALRRLDRDREAISHEIKAFIPSQLKLMGQMGIDLEDEVCRVYPDFSRRDVPRSWEHYLPRLPLALQGLLEGRS
ncbi:MAG: polysaccharide pyruvyl transferase family protein [Deltaproteobacteria bacterium]|nr:polysaccharide pyruvyl transferase family protein [Deltaproteobacteria bacterium]